MPVVKRKYIRTYPDIERIIEVLSIIPTPHLTRIVFIDDSDVFGELEISEFWKYCRELPDNQEKKMEEKKLAKCIYNNPDCPICLKEKLVSTNNLQVEKAKEELRKALENCFNPDNFFSIKGCAQNLLNALDDSTVPEKGDWGIDETANISLGEIEAIKNLKLDRSKVESISTNSGVFNDFYKKYCKSKSIWKPVSELPNKFNHYLIRGAGGAVAYIMPNILDEFLKDKYGKEFCTLTDYINHQEELEKRIERLEQLIKK